LFFSWVVLNRLMFKPQKKTYIEQLIEQGEGISLDFKHSISDSKKIARSISAFANTKGGTLLIGVKDNGAIAGINTDEEYYMVEGAAQLYCKPEVPFDVKRWIISGKTVLEVTVAASSQRPHLAPDKNGFYRAFIRIADENFVASPIQYKIWQAEQKREAITIELTGKEQLLIKMLRTNGRVTVKEFAKAAFISNIEAEEFLTKMVVLRLAKLESATDETASFVPREGV